MVPISFIQKNVEKFIELCSFQEHVMNKDEFTLRLKIKLP